MHVTYTYEAKHYDRSQTAHRPLADEGNDVDVAIERLGGIGREANNWFSACRMQRKGAGAKTRTTLTRAGRRGRSISEKAMLFGRLPSPRRDKPRTPTAPEARRRDATEAV